jgi:hypothetical protein
MPVTALIATLGAFALALLTHLGWWRWRVPLRPTRALLLVFVLAPVVAGGVWFACAGQIRLPALALPAMLLLYVGLVGSYLIAYAGVAYISPSLVIIRALEAAGEAGCSRQDLTATLNADAFILPRVQALFRDGMLRRIDDGFVLTTQGRRIARIIAVWSAVFGVRESS